MLLPLLAQGGVMSVPCCPVVRDSVAAMHFERCKMTQRRPVAALAHGRREAMEVEGIGQQPTAAAAVGGGQIAGSRRSPRS